MHQHSELGLEASNHSNATRSARRRWLNVSRALAFASYGIGVTACGDGGSSRANDEGAGGMINLPTAPTTEPTAPSTAATETAAPTVVPTNTAPGAGGMGGAGGAGGGGGSGGQGGSGGMGPSCQIASLETFARSDTADAWDDNDFSDVVLEGTCPVLVNVTWPHEEGWQDADPSEANLEQTHFTLDSYYSMDLTNKQVNLTIELADEERGPEANAGGYIVSLVSVSTWDRVVPAEPPATAAGGTSSLGDAGLPDAGGLGGMSSLDAGSVAFDAGVVGAGGAGGAVGAGGAAGAGGAGGAATVTQTAYTEAESHPDDRIILRHVGDRATIRFPLPSQTAELGSYDPARVIKINIRIYNMFTGEETMMEMEEGLDDLVDAGAADGDASVSESDASVDPVDAGAPAPTASAEPLAPAAPTRVYDYISAQFAITDFSVSDVGAQ